MRNIITTLCFLFLTLCLSAQHSCPPSTSARAMLLGDSWTHIMWNNRTYKDVFDQFGHADKIERGDFTAIGGTTASYWAIPGNLSIITTDLVANPSIDIVLLSIGGNDFLAGINGAIPGWHTGLNSTQESTLFDNIQNNIQTIINAIENVRPDIEIVFSGYDFLNLTETVINDPGGPTALVWLNLGQPSIPALNSALSRLEQRKVDIANADARVHYVHAMGLMQFVYGYPAALPVFPFGAFLPGTLPLPGQSPPAYSPFPGGDINYPTPPVALANGSDAIHLSDEGYRHLVVNQTVNYFATKFRGSPNATFISEGLLNDGWVKTSGSTGTGGVRIGDDNSGNSFRGVFSFNTSSLPDNATITGASLYINRSSVAGTNPFTSGILGSPMVDVKNGTFGNEFIELTDYLFPADATDAGCFTGTAKDDGYTVRIDLQPAGYGQINTIGKTQFRVYFSSVNGFLDDYITFNNGDQPAPLSPYLDVFFSIPTSISFQQKAESLFVSPNPFGDRTIIYLPEENSGESKLWLFDINGKLVAEKLIGGHSSEITFERNELKQGIYLLEISGSKNFREKLVVQD